MSFAWCERNSACRVTLRSKVAKVFIFKQPYFPQGFSSIPAVFAGTVADVGLLAGAVCWSFMPWWCGWWWWWCLFLPNKLKTLNFFFEGGCDTWGLATAAPASIGSVSAPQSPTEASAEARPAISAPAVDWCCTSEPTVPLRESTWRAND